MSTAVTPNAAKKTTLYRKEARVETWLEQILVPTALSTPLLEKHSASRPNVSRDGGR